MTRTNESFDNDKNDKNEGAGKGPPGRGRERYRRTPRPGRLHNRVRAVMIHSWRYAFEGTARLAADVGVAPSTIRRLLRGDTNPPYRMVKKITEALSHDLDIALSPGELFSLDGSYPTPSVCVLCRCEGCLPDEAYEPDGSLRAQWRGQGPGHWCRYPRSGHTPTACPIS